MAHSQINLLSSDNAEQKINLNYKEVVNDIYRYLKVIKQNNVKTERNLANTLESIITNQVQILERLDIIDNNIKGLQDKITEAETLEEAELEALNLTLKSHTSLIEKNDDNDIENVYNVDTITTNTTTVFSIKGGNTYSDYTDTNSNVNDNANDNINYSDNDNANDNINYSDDDNINNLDSLMANEVNNISNDISNKLNNIGHISRNTEYNNLHNAYTDENKSSYDLEDTSLLTNEILADIKALTKSSELSENTVTENNEINSNDTEYFKEQLPYINNNPIRKKHTMMILE